MKNVLSISLLTLSATTLVACGDTKKVDFTTAQYWQRANASEAVYQRGPKAQQMVQRDISRCVSELRELERLGYIKNAFPAPNTNPDLSDEEIKLQSWETPERDGYLLNEAATYYDFEECMDARGWERVAYLPYKTKTRSELNYVKALDDAKRKTKSGTKSEVNYKRFGWDGQPKAKGDFEELND